MKTFFDEPKLTVILYDVKDIITLSPPGGDEDEMPFLPKDP